MNRLYLLVLLLGIHGIAWSDTARIAVAANFVPTIKILIDEFHKTSVHRLDISSGSSGKLTTQITNGAPYDMFFSADVNYVDRLIKNQLAVKKSKAIYAIGQLVLWSNDDNFYPVNEQSLTSHEWKTLALANPKFAPYGRAAKQVLALYEMQNLKIITAENVAQSFHFAQTQTVSGGFVALSQLKHPIAPESYWLIPSHYYSPIEQASVILNQGAHNQAVRAFSEFMRSEVATDIIQISGYKVSAE